MNVFMIIFIILVLILVPNISFAYLDPGTGSFMIQMIIAALLSASFVMKAYWKKAIGWIFSVFKIKDKKNEANGQ